jgi:hypothetical protein
VSSSRIDVSDERQLLEYLFLFKDGAHFLVKQEEVTLLLFRGHELFLAVLLAKISVLLFALGLGPFLQGDPRLLEPMRNVSPRLLRLGLQLYRKGS